MYIKNYCYINQMGIRPKVEKGKTQNYAELKAYKFILFLYKRNLPLLCQNEQAIELIEYVVLLSGPLLLYLASLFDRIRTLMREALNVHLNSYLCLKFQLI